MPTRSVDLTAEKAAAGALLPHLPKSAILAQYRAAKGNEIASGKLTSPRSSAALAANGFGFFINRPTDIPPLPGWEGQWKPTSVLPEVEVRFPWRGGSHPWLDALIETETHLIGVESKRYEPFDTRSVAGKPPFSKAFWCGKWGERMWAYEWLRDGLAKQPSLFERLDAVQLVKHAFGLRTQAFRKSKSPVLAYVYAEPKAWPQPAGASIPDSKRMHHADEVRWFARMVAGSEVRFVAFTYRDLLARFSLSPVSEVRDHAALVQAQFDC